MKPIIKEQTLKSSGIQTSVSFGIKSSGLHHILGILRNQLYSDKVLAVIREYTCNAVDAHVEVKRGDRPIEVTLPNKMNPYFKVRDFGPALSDDDIADVYAFYGESTKRNSNDQIGMLGIGSKAAFAYGDNFVINSFLGGKKHSYNAFIDPTQIGQISKLSEEDSDEENGIEIVVPVKADDEREFVEKAKDLFKWFSVRPKIHGTAAFDYEDKTTLFEGEDWTWTDGKKQSYNRGDAVVVMGNIGYPIDSYSLSMKDEDSHLNQLLSANLILRVGIGDVEISASREKLQFTDFTRKSLIKKLKKVASELADVVGKEFDNADTLFEAKCLHGTVFDYESGLYNLKDVLKDKLKWKGKTIDSDSFPTYNHTGVDLHNFTQGRRSYQSSGKYKPAETGNINCRKNVVVIKNDVGHRRGIMGKVLDLLINKKETPYLLQFGSKAIEAKWKKDEGFDGEMLLLSELPKFKLADFGYGTQAGGTGTYANKNEKHSAKCFEFDFDHNGDRWDRKKSAWWKIADVDVKNDSGVYVIIDKFEIQNRAKDDPYGPSHDVPQTINRLKESLKEANIDFPKHIYAFKVVERKKVEGKDGWVELNSWIKTTLESVIATQNLNQAWIDIQKIDELHRYAPESGGGYYRNAESKDILGCLVKVRADGLADVDGTLGTFLDKYILMKQDKETHHKIKVVQEISKNYNVDFKSPKGVKPKYAILHQYKMVLAKYSMLALCGRDTWEDDVKREVVTNYLNVIDLCNADKSA